MRRIGWRIWIRVDGQWHGVHLGGLSLVLYALVLIDVVAWRELL